MKPTHLKNITIFIVSKTSAGSKEIFHMTKINPPSQSFPIHSRRIKPRSATIFFFLDVRLHTLKYKAQINDG